jgi:DNA-binding protein HU-beta
MQATYLHSMRLHPRSTSRRVFCWAVETPQKSCYNCRNTCNLVPMNKGELIDAIASQTELPKTEITQVVTATVEAIMKAVSDGQKVTLVGFGSFESRARKAREGRNPKTGDTMTIPATTVPAFSAGKLFKQKVAS